VLDSSPSSTPSSAASSMDLRPNDSVRIRFRSSTAVIWARAKPSSIPDIKVRVLIKGISLEEGNYCPESSSGETAANNEMHTSIRL